MDAWRQRLRACPAYVTPQPRRTISLPQVRGLNATLPQLYLTLAAAADPEGAIQLSYSQLAQRLGYANRSQVSRALQRAEQLGLVARDRAQQRKVAGGGGWRLTAFLPQGCKLRDLAGLSPLQLRVHLAVALCGKPAHALDLARRARIHTRDKAKAWEWYQARREAWSASPHAPPEEAPAEIETAPLLLPGVLDSEISPPPTARDLAHETPPTARDLAHETPPTARDLAHETPPTARDLAHETPPTARDLAHIRRPAYIGEAEKRPYITYIDIRDIDIEHNKTSLGPVAREETELSSSCSVLVQDKKAQEQIAKEEEPAGAPELDAEAAALCRQLQHWGVAAAAAQRLLQKHGLAAVRRQLALMPARMESYFGEVDNPAGLLVTAITDDMPAPEPRGQSARGGPAIALEAAVTAWQECQAELALRVTEAEQAAHVSESVCVGCDGDTVLIQAPHALALLTLSDRFRATVNRRLGLCLQQPVRVQFLTSHDNMEP